MFDDLFDLESSGDVLLRVHVQPGAGRTAVVGRHGTALKVRVAAAPEGGRANDACVALLAGALGIAASQVTLASGDTSRSKRFRISGVDPAELPAMLARAVEAGGAPAGKRATGRESHGPRIR